MFRVVKLSRSALAGQGTFGMVEKKKENEEYVELDIKEASRVIKEISEENGGFVDLLHVNCEGCEWEMMENILENNLLPNIRFKIHSFPLNTCKVFLELYNLVLTIFLKWRT